MFERQLSGTTLLNALLAVFALISFCQCAPSRTQDLDSYGIKLWGILATGEHTEFSKLLLTKADYLRLYPHERGDYYERFYLTPSLTRLSRIAYDAAALSALDVRFAGISVTRVDTLNVPSTKERFELIRGSLLVTYAEGDTLSREIGTLAKIGGTLKFMDIGIELRSSIRPFHGRPASTKSSELIFRVCPDTNVADCAVVMHGRLVDMGIGHRMWKSDRNRQCFFIALQSDSHREITEPVIQRVQMAIERLGRIELRVLAESNTAAPDRLQLNDNNGNSITLMSKILLTDRLFVGTIRYPMSTSDGIDTLIVGLAKEGISRIRGLNPDRTLGVSIDDSLLCVFRLDPKAGALQIPIPSNSSFWERDFRIFRSGALPCGSVTVDRIDGSALD